jgi:thiamine biosynthesis lipoprotein
MTARAQPWLGTLVGIRVDDPELHEADAMRDTQVQAAIDAAFAAVAEVHKLMSFHCPDSDVSCLNRHAHRKSVEVSAWTYRVIERGLEIARASSGLFDFTVAADLLGAGMLPTPDGSDILPKRDSNRASYRDVRLDEGRRIRFARPLWIDLGGIAKGFAIDCAVAALRERGAEAGSVNAGGDIRVFGPSAQTIWVRQPGDPRKVRPLVQLHDAAVATSASYFSQRPSARAGEFATAIVDPLSGRSRGLDLSVSVRATDCMTADALTKVVTVSEDDKHPALAHFGASALMLRETAHGPMQ